MVAIGTETAIYERPVELLQRLIRFDTTNPPGNEKECIDHIGHLLASAGVETTILARDPARPNLLARLPGRGAAQPLLLYAHVDVVTTENQAWTYPPFEATAADGWVWGRGALDDKGGAAMSLCAFLRAKAQGLVPPGDVVLAILCDEERGGAFGAGYLVDSHPDRFEGIRYAIGEVGGSTIYFAGRRFYPVMVAEKAHCVLRATVRGPVAHAAMTVVRGGTAARLGALLTQLDNARLPMHLTPVARQMIEIMSSTLPSPTGPVLRQLLRPAVADRLLRLLGSRGEGLYPLLHNTTNVTGIQGGEQVAATPAELSARIFACLLPGYGPADLMAELRPLVGDQVALDVEIAGEMGPEAPDMGLYPTLREILREADPLGTPMPMLFTAPTDARHFARLGIQTYGFQPMKLPPDLDSLTLAHAANERVPVEALDFGINAIYKALQRFGV